MKTIYVDTATSDMWQFPRRGTPVADETQPHMVRLAWLLEGDYGQTLGEACHLIRLPVGVEMGHLSKPSERHRVAHINGIYDHQLIERGMEMFAVLSEFAEAMGQAALIVAHSWQFHRHVLERSLRYVGMPAREWPASFCAMIGSTDIVRIPREAPGVGFRWPKFSECHERFCGGAEPSGIDPVAVGIQRVRAVRVFYQHIRRAAD